MEVTIFYDPNIKYLIMPPAEEVYPCSNTSPTLFHVLCMSSMFPMTNNKQETRTPHTHTVPFKKMHHKWIIQNCSYKIFTFTVYSSLDVLNIICTSAGLQLYLHVTYYVQSGNITFYFVHVLLVCTYVCMYVCMYVCTYV